MIVVVFKMVSSEALRPPDQTRARIGGAQEVPGGCTEISRRCHWI